MPDENPIRVNVSLALAALAILAAAYNGGNNFFKAGAAVQAFDSRVTTIEAQIDQADADRAQRRADYSASMAAIAARLTANEQDSRASASQADRNSTAIASLSARQDQFTTAIDKLSEAINRLSLQQGIQTEILQRLEARPPKP